MPEPDPAYVEEEIMASIIAGKIVPPTGDWADFNIHHRAWVKMNRLAKIRSFFMDADDVPAEPDPTDYPI